MSIYQYAEVDLRGNLASIEVVSKEEGKSKTILSVAVNEREWTNQQGETIQHTNFIRVVVTDKLKVSFLESANIGDIITIKCGSLHTFSYQKSDGTRGYGSEVQLFNGASRIFVEPKPTKVKEA